MHHSKGLLLWSKMNPLWTSCTRYPRGSHWTAGPVERGSVHGRCRVSGKVPRVCAEDPSTSGHLHIPCPLTRLEFGGVL